MNKKKSALIAIICGAVVIIAGVIIFIFITNSSAITGEWEFSSYLRNGEDKTDTMKDSTLTKLTLKITDGQNGEAKSDDKDYKVIYNKDHLFVYSDDENGVSMYRYELKDGKLHLSTHSKYNDDTTSIVLKKK